MTQNGYKLVTLPLPFWISPLFRGVILKYPPAVAQGWHISVGDISTAFLHALVDGDFYVISPLEFYPDALCGSLRKLCTA